MIRMNEELRLILSFWSILIGIVVASLIVFGLVWPGF